MKKVQNFIKNVSETHPTVYISILYLAMYTKIKKNWVKIGKYEFLNQFYVFALVRGQIPEKIIGRCKKKPNFVKNGYFRLKIELDLPITIL